MGSNLVCFTTVPFVASVSLKQKLKKRVYDKDASQSHSSLRLVRDAVSDPPSAARLAESERFLRTSSIRSELEHQAAYSHGTHG
jgi:hypothetical protein